MAPEQLTSHSPPLRQPPVPVECPSASPAIQRPASDPDPGSDAQSAPINPVVTSPSTVRLPSRPSKRAIAPRPHSEA